MLLTDIIPVLFEVNKRVTCKHNLTTVSIELNEYFNQLAREAPNPNFSYSQFLRQGRLPLLAKLIQDCQKPTAELLAELKEILLPIGSTFATLCASEVNETNEAMNVDSTTPTSGFITHYFLNEFFEKTSYGHPHCTAPFTAWSCTFWQVKDMSLLGPELSKHFLVNFVMRQAARMILEGAFTELSAEIGAVESIEKDTDTKNNTAKDTKDTGDNAVSIEPNTKKQSKKRKSTVEVPSTPSKSTSPTKPSAVEETANTPTRKQPQISSFFSKLERKKESFASFTPGEYFQPFFLKPDTTLAPINALRTVIVPVDAEIADLKRSSEFKKLRCLCVGMDGVASRAVLKLLRFEENNRPAYVGTWRNRGAPFITGRRPFGRVEEVDYEYDSDEEWEGVEGEEGESLSSDEDENDDDEEEDEGMLSSNESEDVKNVNCIASFSLVFDVELVGASWLLIR